ncbi:MAG: hypothetical protein ACRC8Z_10790 [Empedobacter falsenii]
MKEIKLPLFLLANEPTEKYTGIEYIYSPHYMSLIMVVSENDTTTLLNSENINKPRMTYQYQDESFEFVIIQNNVLSVGWQLAPEVSELDFLDSAFEWFENYLKWEESNIDENLKSKFN